MSKIVLVETLTTFRGLYAIKLEDNEPTEYAVEDVVMEQKGLDEFAQQHIATDIFSHRVVTEEEYIKVFDEMNDYLREWPQDQKKKFIYKRD